MKKLPTEDLFLQSIGMTVSESFLLSDVFSFVTMNLLLLSKMGFIAIWMTSMVGIGFLVGNFLHPTIWNWIRDEHSAFWDDKYVSIRRHANYPPGN